MKRILGLLLIGVGLAAAACGSASSPTGGSVWQAGTDGQVTTAVAPALSPGTSLVLSFTGGEPSHTGAPPAVGA
jgi:hypothetical protein